MAVRVVALFVAVGGTLGCHESAAITDPQTPWPQWLSALDVDPLGDGDAAHRDGLGYRVGHELWVDGLTKHRLLLLGDGNVIDNRDRDRWGFPAGTVALKTLAWDGHPIETRGIRAQAEGAWEYVAYRWLPDGEDAERLDLAAPLAIAGGPAGAHEIPSSRQCRQCHESQSTPLLGLTELQLADATNDGGSELERLDRAGGLLVPAPVSPRHVTHPDPSTAALLGWFVGNCVHCHNGGTAENASFDLDPDVALDNVLGQPTQSSASASGIRVVPGDPDASVLYLAVAGRSADADAMPPVAAERRDLASIDALRRWIEALPQ